MVPLEAYPPYDLEMEIPLKGPQAYYDQYQGPWLVSRHPRAMFEPDHKKWQRQLPHLVRALSQCLQK